MAGCGVLRRTVGSLKKAGRRSRLVSLFLEVAEGSVCAPSATGPSPPTASLLVPRNGRRPSPKLRYSLPTSVECCDTRTYVNSGAHSVRGSPFRHASRRFNQVRRVRQRTHVVGHRRLYRRLKHRNSLCCNTRDLWVMRSPNCGGGV